MADQNRQGRLFLGCFLALVATAFAFSVRGAVLDTWGQQFQLSEEQKGIISGVGVYPFAISIILFSLIIDRIGYGTAMLFAFVGHVIGTLMTIFATSIPMPTFQVLYIATFIYALANGTVEAVINPVVATVYKDNKTHWLNVLHAGWPGGLALAGLLGIAVLQVGGKLGSSLPGDLWQWQMAILLIPIVLYGVLLAGLKFPVQERVEAGVSYSEMLDEFGWASAYIVSFLVIMGISQVLKVFGTDPIEWDRALVFAIIPTFIFAWGWRGLFYTLALSVIAVILKKLGYDSTNPIFVPLWVFLPTLFLGLPIRKFGRPIFVFLMLVMMLLATTELGTDGWIQSIMKSVMNNNETHATLFFVYTSLIMFVLRFFAGPIVHRISPLGLLAACAALAALGLTWLGNAGTALTTLFAAATLYGVGKTFFWPTTLGTVSELYPRGGALLINAISGVGMISVGTLGLPAIGTVQDMDINRAVQSRAADIHSAVAVEKQGMFFNYQAIDSAKVEQLSADQRAQLTQIESETKQHVLAKIAILPVIMCVCYLGLILYFKSQGGYKAEVLTGHGASDEKFTGGVEGPGEA